MTIVKKFLKQYSQIVVLVVLLSGIQLVSAWTAPGSVAPGGNVDGPITNTSVAQYKEGPLGVNTTVLPGVGFGLTVSGAAAIGGDLGAGGDVTGGGDVTATAFYYTSDRRLKENVLPIASPLEKVLLIDGVSFTWKKDGVKSLGFVAQDVEEVFPELVKTSAGEEGYKSVQYANIVPVLVEAIKEQQKQIAEIQEEVLQLKQNESK